MNSAAQDYNNNAYQEHNGNERSNVGGVGGEIDGNGQTEAPQRKRVSKIGSGVRMAIVSARDGSSDTA